MNPEAVCPGRPCCPSPNSTPEELERRAIIQRNDLILHEAVIKNDADTVRKILRDPIDINSRNNVRKVDGFPIGFELTYTNNICLFILCFT